MPSLADLQFALQKHIREEDDGICDQLIKPLKGSLTDRLSIYANGYYLRFLEVLQQDYPLLYDYLGEDSFTEFADVYSDTYPSRFYSIADFTKQFPQFLAEHRPEQAYLSELAQLTKALGLSLEARDAPVLNRASLSKIPLQSWPSVSFMYHPSVQYLSFQWNTFSLWKALIQKTALPSLKEEPASCIVWRKELQSYALCLTDAECKAFCAFQEGSCFADVCEVVYSSGLIAENEVAVWLASCLTRWLDHHWFSEVYHS